MSRLIYFVICLLSIVMLPWQVSVLLMVVGVLSYKFYLESVFLSICMWALYSPDTRSAIYFAVAWFIFFSTFESFVRPRIWSYAN